MSQIFIMIIAIIAIIIDCSAISSKFMLKRDSIIYKFEASIDRETRESFSLANNILSPPSNVLTLESLSVFLSLFIDLVF